MKLKLDLIFIAITMLFIGICTYLKQPIYYALLMSYLLLCIISIKQGMNQSKIIKVTYKSVQGVLFVIVMMSMIGMMIPLWMSNGTIPAMIKLGLKYLSSTNIVLGAFLSCVLTSMMLGTGIGTVSTAGIVFLSLSNGLGIPEPIMIGAIVSGSYFGDRSSPLSSTALLISKMTDTKLMTNIKYMMRTILPTALIASVLYLIIGNKYIPDAEFIKNSGDTIQLINSNFNTGFIVFLPVVVMLTVIFILRRKVMEGIFASLITSVIMALFIFKMDPMNVLSNVLIGFHPKNPQIALIVSGSGLISMIKVLLVISLSASINGLLTETRLLDNMFEKFKSRIINFSTLYFRSSVLSLLITLLTCNQSMTSLITGKQFSSTYDKHGVERNQLALSIADFGVITVPVIPWNINAIVVTTVTGFDSFGYIPYSYLCFLLPVISLLYSVLQNRRYIKGFNMTQSSTI